MTFTPFGSFSILLTSAYMKGSILLMLLLSLTIVEFLTDCLLESRSFLERRFFFRTVDSLYSSSLARSTLYCFIVGHFL